MNCDQELSSSSPIVRVGTTLSEVLVSMLVMSIGVVSLATLFPISVLRSVQATQLTNSANLRYNVEAFLGPQPQLYTVGPSWVASTNYAVGQLVTPTELTSLKSPAVVFQCTTAGQSGPFEPNWNFTNFGSTTEVMPLPPPPPPTPAVWQTFLLQNYVIDPLGESVDAGGNATVELQYRRTANGDFFGNDGLIPPTPRQVIRAFSGFSSTPSVVAADDVATLPDSWVNQGESVQVAYVGGNTTCTFGGLQGSISTPLPFGNYPLSRVVLFDLTGKVSHVRPVVNLTGAAPTQTIDWTGFGPLPTGFIPVQGRVESKDRRYTWMLSVRRAFSGASYMDVVVFFKRPFSGKDEQLYPATFTSTTDLGVDAAPGIAGIDDDGNGITDFAGGVPDPAELGFPGSDDIPRNWVVIQYDAAGDKPFVKKGGFVTDADNLRWYRIIDVVEGDAFNGYTPLSVILKAGLLTAQLNPNPQPVPSLAGYPFTAPYIPDAAVAAFTTPKAIFLRLDNSVDESGLQPAANGGVPNGRAMIMRGIVDVYPIRTHLTWGN